MVSGTWYDAPYATALLAGDPLPTVKELFQRSGYRVAKRTARPNPRTKYVTVTVGHPDWSSGWTEDYEVEAESIGAAKRALAAEGYIIKGATDRRSMMRQIKGRERIMKKGKGRSLWSARRAPGEKNEWIVTYRGKKGDGSQRWSVHARSRGEALKQAREARLNPRGEYGSLERSDAARDPSHLSPSTLSRIQKKALDSSNTIHSIVALEKHVLKWALKKFPRVRKKTLADAVSDAVSGLWRMNPGYRTLSAEGTTVGKWGGPRRLIKRALQHQFGLTSKEVESALSEVDSRGKATVEAYDGEVWALSPGRDGYGYELDRVSPPPKFYPAKARKNPARRDVAMLIGEDGGEWAKWAYHRQGLMTRPNPNLIEAAGAPDTVSAKMHADIRAAAARLAPGAASTLDLGRKVEAWFDEAYPLEPKTADQEDIWDAHDIAVMEAWKARKNPRKGMRTAHYRGMKGAWGPEMELFREEDDEEVEEAPPPRRRSRGKRRGGPARPKWSKRQIRETKALLKNPKLSAFVAGGRGLKLGDLTQDRWQGSGSRGGYTDEERDALPSKYFLKPEMRSWPVADRMHAKEALKSMVRGLGNVDEYPMLVMRLAQVWPVTKANKSVWGFYTKNRAEIGRKCGCEMPTAEELKDMVRLNPKRQQRRKGRRRRR